MQKGVSTITLLASLSLFLNIWGIEWGLPVNWHPDELVKRAGEMIKIASFDHNYYAYGAWSVYEVLLGAIMPVKILNYLGNFWHSRELHVMTNIGARLMSAFMGSGVIIIIYLITRKLFDRRAGLVTALLTAVTMGLVNLSHFATVDVPSLFWFCLACLAAVYIFSNEGGKWYLLAGIFTGLAAAVRYVGGLALLVVLAAHFLKKDKRRGGLEIFLAVVVVTFALVNPVIFLCEYPVGFLAEMFFNSYRNHGDQAAFGPLLGEMANAMGWPMFLLGVGGAAYGILLIFKRDSRPKILLVWSMLVPYYLIVGRMHVSNLRYALPIIPFVLIMAGKMISDFERKLPKPDKLLWRLALFMVFGYSLVYSVAADLAFANDSRYLLTDWAIKNFEPGSTIEMTPYSPIGLTLNYPVVVRPMNNNEEDTMEALNDSGDYNKAVIAVTKITEIFRKRGLCQPKGQPYKPWYVLGRENLSKASKSYDFTGRGLAERAPDYFITSSFYTNRFLNDQTSADGGFFRDLKNEKTPYRLIKTFHYDLSKWLRPEVEFVNPEIEVWKIESGNKENRNWGK